MTAENRRILVIDDMASIRADFAKIIGGTSDATELAELEQNLFGSSPAPRALPRFELGFASQGLEGIAMARDGLARGEPFAMAFVDVRMPPGLDGVETVIRLWELDPRIEIAICTAYSDYTWQQMLEKLTRPGQFLVLGKPFESTAVRQIAMALTEKWNLARMAERSRDDLDALVKERTGELEKATARLQVQMNERLELERRLQHAQKLEALGRLVAGVAHEINNPLSYVLASLGHLDEELVGLQGAVQAARELREVVSEARAGGKRIQQIVQDLTTFSRPDKSGVETVVLEDVVRFALRMASPSFPIETRVEQQFQPVPVVRANPGLLSQVFVNLLANAGRAMGGVPVDRRLLQVGIEAAGAGALQVTVRDLGVGIPESLLSSIFDPFFTTQTQGEGTGLGLYICQGIVQRMGGEIRIESREGVGTLARVILPLVPPARTVERPPTVGVLAS